MTLTVSRRLGITALVAVAVLAVVYPALRPYTDETTADGARAFASAAWAGAHSAAMVAFVLLPVGILGAAAHLPLGRGRTAATVLAWLGGAFVLPYYGAETFGLGAIGARAAADGDTGLLGLAEDVRMGGVALSFFGPGLLLLAASGVALAVASWRTPARLGGLLAGVALALYLPQYYVSPALRITHGVVLAAGCTLLAVALARRATASPAPASTSARSTRRP